jgi:hypothetical protein
MKAMRRQDRALALISLLMVSVLCMMMLAAFLQSNRNYLQLFNRGVSQDKISDSTRTLADFIRCHLEESKSWGKPFASDELKVYPGDLHWYQHKVDSSPDLGIVTGELPNGLVFRLDILNNLRGAGVRDGLQPKSCRATIAIYDNPANVDLAATPKALLEAPDQFVLAGGCRLFLRNAALFDSGVLASTGIALHARNLSFLSKDPIRNQVRSNGAIVIPDATSSPTNYDFGFLKESTITPGAWEKHTPRGYDGTVWAKDAILFGDDDSLDETKIGQAMEITNANFVPNAQTQNSIPELEPEDIKVAGDDAKVLSAGVYRFVNRWVQYDHDGDGDPYDLETKRIEVLEQRDDAHGTGLPEKFHYIKGHLPAGTDHDTTKLFDYNTGLPLDVPHSAREAGTNEDTFELWDIDGDESGLTVDLSGRTMFVKPDAVIDVPGDFSVTSVGNEDAEYEQPVRLVLGSTAEGKLGTVRAQGDIRVEGYVTGKGSLISHKDVIMRPNNVHVDSDVESDLAVYARKNVVILDELNSEDSDYVSFRGLIYAGENFHFRSDTDLHIEGALVARKGHVFLIAGTANHDANEGWSDIVSSHDLKVTYNPAYLDSLLNVSAQERTKVEVLSWRPGL